MAEASGAIMWNKSHPHTVGSTVLPNVKLVVWVVVELMNEWMNTNSKSQIFAKVIDKGNPKILFIFAYFECSDFSLLEKLFNADFVIVPVSFELDIL